jgi:hypothetical protein
MQVLARVRHRHLARLGRMLEVMMAAGRADIEPAVRFKLANNITRILAHRTPRLQPKVAWDGAVGKCLSRLLPIVIKRHQLPRYRLRRIGRQERRTKQGVDGRDFRREDGASRLMPTMTTRCGVHPPIPAPACAGAGSSEIQSWRFVPCRPGSPLTRGRAETGCVRSMTAE